MNALYTVLVIKNNKVSFAVGIQATLAEAEQLASEVRCENAHICERVNGDAQACKINVLASESFDALRHFLETNTPKG